MAQLVAGTPASTTTYDPQAVAMQILNNTADEMASAMMPSAELSPLGSVISNGIVAVAASASAGQGISWQWPCNGIAVGLRVSTRDGLAASMAGLLLRVQVDGTDELFPSAAGQGAGFLPFANISGSGTVNFARYAFRRLFTQATYWTIYVNNTTGGNVTCDVSMDYINTKNPRS
jgi:hypothetical protein